MSVNTIANGALGLLPVIAFLTLLIQFDVFKLVRLSYVIKLIAAGIGCAITAYFISPWVMSPLNIDYFSYYRLAGPLVEEMLKASIILFLIRAHRIGFAFDAVIAGFAIGTGFALLENYYFLRNVETTQTAIWAVRGFGTAIMHGGVTAIFAVITQIVTPQQTKTQLYHALPGYGAAAGLHILYNQFILDPVTSAVVVMTGLALALVFILQRGQRSIDQLLQANFAHYHSLLRDIRSGQFSEDKIGTLLQSLKIHLDPSETSEILRYVELHAELVLFGEQYLIAQSDGKTIEITDAIRNKLAQFNYLDERVGQSVRLLLKDHIKFSRNEFFQLYKLSQDAGKAVEFRHDFNSDLLLHDEDRDAAHREFPDIFFALDHEELRKRFLPYDQRANKAKRNSKQWGIFAIILVTVSLLLASAQPLYDELPPIYLKTLSVLTSIALLAGLVIAIFGLNYQGRKSRWLADRLATERIRSFHFRHAIESIDEILAGAGDKDAQDKFLARRKTSFAHFDEAVLARIDEKLFQLVHDQDDLDVEYEDSGESTIRHLQSPHAEQFFAAYARLRFEPQLNYCNHVLRQSKSFWKPSALRQIKLLSTIVLYGLLAVFVFQQLVLIGIYTDIQWMKEPAVHVLTIWGALVALAAKIFQEGFQPKREIERMRQYRLALRRIHQQFRDAKTPDRKIDAMLEMEKMSDAEVTLFLKSTYEAEFII